MCGGKTFEARPDKVIRRKGNIPVCMLRADITESTGIVNLVVW